MPQAFIRSNSSLCLSTTFIILHTVNNKKNTPLFFKLPFSRTSPEPLELQKIYWHLFISFFKELLMIQEFLKSGDKISWYLQKRKFANKKLAIRKNPSYWKILKIFSINIKSRNRIYIKNMISTQKLSRNLFKSD